MKDGVMPDEIGIFVRSADEFVRAEEAVKNTNTPFMILYFISTPEHEARIDNSNPLFYSNDAA